jgi:hypothetical protein
MLRRAPIPPMAALDSRGRVLVRGIFICSTLNAEECLWKTALPLGTKIQTRNVTRGLYPIHDMSGIIVPSYHIER